MWFECKEGGLRLITWSVWITFTPSGKQNNKTTAIFLQKYSAWKASSFFPPLWIMIQAVPDRHPLKTLQCSTKQTSIPVHLSLTEAPPNRIPALPLCQESPKLMHTKTQSIFLFLNHGWFEEYSWNYSHQQYLTHPTMSNILYRAHTQLQE